MSGGSCACARRRTPWAADRRAYAGGIARSRDRQTHQAASQPDPMPVGIRPASSATHPRSTHDAVRLLAMPTRSAFTLIEILVSIMIFMVVGGAMVGILLVASTLYREGEAQRQATDETVAILAALDDDLMRAVPESQGGAFVAQASAAGDGNVAVGWIIRRKDVGTMNDKPVTDTVDQTRRAVLWQVDANGRLLRGETDVAGAATKTPQEAAIESIFTITAADSATLTEGCLHFAGWFTSSADPRTAFDQWASSRNAGALIAPAAPGEIFNTATITGGGPIEPFPDAVRFTLVLTGGSRFAQRGTIAGDVEASDTSVRIAGVRGLRTAPGAVLRVGNEWIGYDQARENRVSWPTPVPADQPLLGRGVLRSTPSRHDSGTPVLIGQLHSLTRALPR